MHNGRSNSIAAADQIHSHISGFPGRGKHCGSAAAADSRITQCAHAVVAYGENSILRQTIGGSTGIVHSAGSQFNLRFRRIICVVGCDCHMVKFTGSRHIGYYQDRTGNTTFASTSGGVAHGHIRLALTLRDIGGGAALVQLNGSYTSQCHEHMRFFLCRIAHRSGRHGAVCLEQHYSTVLLYTNGGTGIVTAVSGLGNNDFAVPYHGNQRIHSLQNLNILSLLFTLACFCLCQRGTFLKDIDRAVIKGCHKGAAGVVVMYHTIHYQIARRLTGIDIEPGCIYTAYYVQTSLVFIDMCLIRGSFECPSLFYGITVAVTSNDFCPTIAGIDLHNIGNRLGCSFLIIGNNQLLGNIRRNGIVFHGGHRVVRSVNLAPFYQT